MPSTGGRGWRRIVPFLRVSVEEAARRLPALLGWG
jgi:hypothetical protein